MTCPVNTENWEQAPVGLWSSLPPVGTIHTPEISQRDRVSAGVCPKSLPDLISFPFPLLPPSSYIPSNTPVINHNKSHADKSSLQGALGEDDSQHTIFHGIGCAVIYLINLLLVDFHVMPEFLYPGPCCTHIFTLLLQQSPPWPPLGHSDQVLWWSSQLSGPLWTLLKNKNVNTTASNPLPLLATMKINESVCLFIFL